MFTRRHRIAPSAAPAPGGPDLPGTGPDLPGTMPSVGGAPRPGRPHARRGAAWWVGRVLALPVAAGLAVALVVHGVGWRSWEAWTAGHVTALVTARPAYSNRSTFFVDLGRPDVFGLRVTPECTSALILVGLLGITAILLVLTRLSLSRLVLAAALSSVVFVAVNTARLVMIALATRQWGLGSGFHWSHVWAGTFVTVIGVAGVVALYLAVIGAAGRGRRVARP